MKKLIIKLTIKVLRMLANKVNMDFDNDEKNDLLEAADWLQLKLEAMKSEKEENKEAE